ncbi:fucose isomerase [candidate division KSB1 bacterium]|nr:fucose isomerase [candidate division KSB1 bacterium]
MTTPPVRLGFCPIGKFVFSHEDAMKQKKLLEAKLRHLNIETISLDDVLLDGIVRSQEQVAPVVAHFQRSDIDAVFMPHCNFGTEGAVGAIAKKLGLPVLLWGPRDEAPLPDGKRLRDSLCGLFASSKVLHALDVPFTYIENCRIDDPAFAQGIDTFIRAVNISTAFSKGIRIGHIGQRIDFFWSTIINEGELLRKFNVEVLPVDMVQFIAAAKARTQKNRAAYREELQTMRQTMVIEGFDTDEPMINVLAVRDEMLEIAGREQLEGIAIQDFMSLVDEMGAYCFYANSAVSDRYPIGCESDIHGAISAAILQRAALGTSPAFLADLTVRHPSNDNAVLLWHAGAPLSMCHPDERITIGQHWILPSPLSGMPHFRLKHGPITIARFDGDERGYRLAVGEGSSIDGPRTRNNYVWMAVDNWQRWERVLIEGPFMHHAGMIYGHFARALAEACKYIDGLDLTKLNALS